MKTFKDGLTKAITPSQRRNRVLKHFLSQMVKEGKPSHHSPMGSTVAVLLAGLEEAGVPYVLSARPGMGYIIQPSRDLELSSVMVTGDPAGSNPSEKAVMSKVFESPSFRQLVTFNECDLTKAEEAVLLSIIKRLTATPE